MTLRPDLLISDLRVSLRSLWRAKGLAISVILTLALGIGANAAIFSVVRGILLRPLANRDEDRLVYIRQSAPGIAAENTTFSVPEIQDFRDRVKSVSAFGDFSTIDFTMIGLGDPRVLKAGVVDGSYFEVMGLHPVLGRLLDAHDDGPNAAGAVVLTYRFWTTALKSDPTVIGKTVRLGSRTATVVGVLEPSVPYPAETEIIANVVTSPHHMSAMMRTGRVHRMTELFGRLAPGVDIQSAAAELRAVQGAMVKEHPEAYPPNANFSISTVGLREQITSRAKTVLLVLLLASVLVFIIACSNAANLILARTVRHENELAMRAALGASAGALRRTLLADSLLLCGSGAVLGVLIARPMVTLLAGYASRFSVRAIDLTVDSSLLWVGALLALIAAVLLAFIPRLPLASVSHASNLSSNTVRVTGSTNGRLRIFAVTQIAASFMLLAGAGMLLKTLLALQSAPTGFNTHNVLALDVPVVAYGRTPDQITGFYKESTRQISALPGVEGVAIGTNVPWRDAGSFPDLQFSVEGHVRAPGEEDPRARFRTISPGFFAAIGVPIISGRDFNESDGPTAQTVVIVSQSVAKRMFPNEDAVNHNLMWTDPVMKFIDVSTAPRRIVGVAADVDDENVVAGPSLTVYHPLDQEKMGGGRMFVHTSGDPYPLVPSITRILRQLSVDQPVEHAATLEDVRAEVLTPDRLSALVFGSFAAVALVIAVIGVAGVLAFSVSGRTREFGIRLACGAQPGNLLRRVITEGAVMAAIGIVVGCVIGYPLGRIAGAYIGDVRMPGALPVLASAGVLLVAAIVASVLPAARAARVNAMDALRSE